MHVQLSTQFFCELLANLHLQPYYGDEDDTENLYHSEAKRGITAFHAYATLYARINNDTRWRVSG